MKKPSKRVLGMVEDLNSGVYPKATVEHYAKRAAAALEKFEAFAFEDAQKNASNADASIANLARTAWLKQEISRAKKALRELQEVLALAA